MCNKIPVVSEAGLEDDMLLSDAERARRGALRSMIRASNRLSRALSALVQANAVEERGILVPILKELVLEELDAARVDVRHIL